VSCTLVNNDFKFVFRFLIRKPNLTQAQTEVSHSLNLEFAGSDEGTVTIDNTEVICSPDPESDRGDEGAINIDNLRNKKRIYSNLRKCREQWQQEFKWLASRDNKAYCKSCRKFLEGGRRHMKRHEICQLHKKNESKIKGTCSIEKLLYSEEKKKELRLKKEAQVKAAVHLAEHNLSFLYMEHANLFYSFCFPDSQIAKNFNCSRTKMADIIKNKIAPYARGKLVEKMNSSKFAIIIDETTDVSSKKSLVIAVRFFDNEAKKVKDHHFAFVELESSTAESIFNGILGLFKANNVVMNNLTGFASDNASVMMGDIKGVKSRFLDILPNLFVMPCISHSLHLCASKACTVLPSDLERLCHEIYNYFAHSAKRQKSYIHFQEFTNTEPHRLLRPCQTRWLSLEMVVHRICEQWAALTLYFRAEDLEDKHPSAVFILSCLDKQLYLIYFKFLKHILSMVVKLNTFFQAETPKFHIFINNVTSIYKTILKFYLRPDIVDSSIPLHRINPANPDYFLKLPDVYLGIEAEQFINSHKIDQLEPVRVNCLNFYVRLCSEIRSRVDFSDETLNMLEILNPQKVFMSNKPGLSKLVSRFPNLIQNINVTDLDLEWRSLSNIKPDENISDFNELIKLFREQN
jgi:hypothetical protein